jgi:N-acetylglucosamine kinase-like BadF-type ATPase
MILIADSGSTKTDWAWMENGNIVCRMETKGINPVHQSEEEIRKIIEEREERALEERGERREEREYSQDVNHCGVQNDSSNLSPLSSLLSPLKILFFGAGCIPEKKKVVEKVLRELFPQAETIEVESDLLGAARAVCHDKEGIACILGTGSNSCLYDGHVIVSNIPPLGYILGDEGSGAVLGKMFMNALFKGALPSWMKDDFLHSTGLTYPTIINKVYREPMANRFLASTSLYIGQHLDVEPLRDLVKQNFRNFFRKNVIRYERRDLPIGAIGSIAYHYQDILREVATEEGFVMGTIAKSPMEGLLELIILSHAE